VTAIFTSASEDRRGAEVANRTAVTPTGHEQAVLHGVLAGTDAAADALAELPERAVASIERIVRESFAYGVQTSFRIVAAVAIAGFRLAIFVLARTPDPRPSSG